MRKIIFTADFATKKKGDKWECDGQLASQLVRVDKVADFTDIKDAPAKEPKTSAKAK